MRTRAVYNGDHAGEAPLGDQAHVAGDLAVTIGLVGGGVEPAHQFPVLALDVLLQGGAVQHLFKVHIEIAALAAEQLAAVGIQQDMIPNLLPLGVYRHVGIEHFRIEIERRAKGRIRAPACEFITDRPVGGHKVSEFGKVRLIVHALRANVLVVGMELQRVDVAGIVNIRAVRSDIIISDVSRRCRIICTVDIIPVRIPFEYLKSREIIVQGVITSSTSKITFKKSIGVVSFSILC